MPEDNIIIMPEEILFSCDIYSSESTELLQLLYANAPTLLKLGVQTKAIGINTKKDKKQTLPKLVYNGVVYATKEEITEFILTNVNTSKPAPVKQPQTLADFNAKLLASGDDDMNDKSDIDRAKAKAEAMATHRNPKQQQQQTPQHKEPPAMKAPTELPIHTDNIGSDDGNDAMFAALKKKMNSGMTGNNNPHQQPMLPLNY
jgi:hypothetical protein